MSELICASGSTMASRPKAYLDIAPLAEEQWTGIPAVSAALAEEALGDDAISWEFFYESICVSTQELEILLARRTGKGFLARLEKSLIAKGRKLLTGPRLEGSAVFLNVKPFNRLFAREALVVHDLSALITPEFHHSDTIAHHCNRLRGDIEGSDAFFCVSHATMEDLRRYLGVPRHVCRLLPLGVRFDAAQLAALVRSRSRVAEPFIVVLGTLEPRKNGRLVFEWLKSVPRVLDRYRIVFVGRGGWLGERERLGEQLSELGARSNRITFTGFVSEDVKLRLLYWSRFCIYPSLFEGFGIPIAEAAALGKYIVCSEAASMREVAPEMCFFFDPSSVVELAEAVERAEVASANARIDRMSLDDTMARVAARGQDRAYGAVRNWVLES